jgi:leader peptidase (prepilin peptidase) / N-methyltransferase
VLIRGCLPASLEYFHIGLAAIFGLIFGSFLNVCIYRIPRDLSVLAPRSFCPNCTKQISWYDNLPLLSFFLLRGKCRNCSSKIQVRYPLVELCTAIAFAGIACQYDSTVGAAKWAIFECAMIVLFWTDFEDRILPDEFTLGGTIVGVCLAFLVKVPGTPAELLMAEHSQVRQSVLNLISGAVLLAGPIWFTGVLYSKLRKREGLGIGDVKLLVLIGVFLGVDNGLLALLIGACGGSIVGLAYILLTRQDARSYPLPFGSFICAAGAILPLLSHVQSDRIESW